MCIYILKNKEIINKNKNMNLKNIKQKKEK